MKIPMKYVAAAIIAVLAIIWTAMANGLVGYDERVKQTYSQIQIDMQRQADLLPNLAEVVRGAAGHENKTLTEITQARAALTSVAKMKPEDLAANPELQKQLVEAQAAAGKAMISLNAVREAYPDLKAVALFQSLMAEVSGAQNRIAVSRRRNQLAVQEYNQVVRVFPRSIVANVHGYRALPYFAATDTAQSGPPQIKF